MGAVGVWYKGLWAHTFKRLEEEEEEGGQFWWQDASLSPQEKYERLQVGPEMLVSSHMLRLQTQRCRHPTSCLSEPIACRRG